MNTTTSIHDELNDTRIKEVVQVQLLGSKTAEDGDGNVGKTIRLITEDKKGT